MKQSKRLVILTDKSGIQGSVTLTQGENGVVCAVDLLRSFAGDLRVAVGKTEWRFPLEKRKQKWELPTSCSLQADVSLVKSDRLHVETAERKTEALRIENGQNEKPRAQADSRAQKNEAQKEQVTRAFLQKEQSEFVFSKRKENEDGEKGECLAEKIDYDDWSTAKENFYPSNLAVVTMQTGERRILADTDSFFSRKDVHSLLFDQTRSKRTNDEEQSQQATKPSASRSVFCRTENDDRQKEAASTVACTVREGRKVEFYEKSSDRIRSLLTEFPRDRELEKLMPDTKWVRVEFDGKGRYYLFGVVGDPVEYLCYGVPAKYSAMPPAAISLSAKWLPRDPSRPQAEGYWLLFQDGKTGKSVPADW